MDGLTDRWRTEQKATRAPLKAQALEISFDDLLTLLYSFSLRKRASPIGCRWDQRNRGGFALLNSIKLEEVTTPETDFKLLFR